MSAESNGWLLKLHGGWRAALGLRELVHVLPYSPRLYPVPQTPAHVRHVILWESRILPVLDLAAYLEKSSDRGPHPATDLLSLDHMVAIVAYHAASTPEVSLGGMLLGKVPERIQVVDEQACALPGSPPAWHQVAISCFEHPDHGAVPILDLPRLFSGALAAPARPTFDPDSGLWPERVAAAPALLDGAEWRIDGLSQGPAVPVGDT